MLAFAGLPAVDDGRERGDGVQRTGGVVHIGVVVLHRPVRMAGEVHVAGHGLRHAVEADAPAIRAGCAERGAGGEDDVWLDGGEAGVIQAHGGQRVRRQVGDHHICRGGELAGDLLPLRRARIQREATLVAIQGEVAAALAVGCDGRHIAVFTATHFLHPNHIRAKIAQQRATERPGDVAAEIEHPDVSENRHAISPNCVERRIIRAFGRLLERRGPGRLLRVSR